MKQKFWFISFKYAIINDVHLCEDIDICVKTYTALTDHINAIFRTRPRAAHVVRASDQVPSCTMTAIRGLNHLTLSNKWVVVRCPYIASLAKQF